MKERAARVLMNKQNGDLLEGYRVHILGNEIDDIKPPDATYKISLDIISHDGWILYHPGAGQFAWFMNRHCDKFFEDLGEL